MARFAVILIALSALTVGAALPAATVPPDHWAYELADELIIRGLWTGVDHGERPWTRSQFAAAAGYLREQYERGEVGLHRATLGILRRLLEEFALEVVRWRADRGPADRAASTDRPEKVRPSIEVGALFQVDGGYRLIDRESPFLVEENDEAAEPETSDFAYRGRVFPTYGAGYGDELALWGRARGDTDGLHETDWRGLEWKGGIAAQFDYGYISWQPTEWLRLWAGRDQVQWGRSLGGSLLLSGKAPATDGYGYAIDFGPLRLSFFHSALDVWRVFDDDGHHKDINRYLVGHRLSWRIAPGIVVGAAEATTYGGEGRTMELAYLNPLMLHYLEQLCGRVSNDNIFWQFDFDIVPVPGYRLWGQLMIDDFQYSPTAMEPHHLAFLLGGGWADPLGLAGMTLELEYLKVWNWVYNVLPDFNKLLYLGHCLGFPRGNDADRWSMRLGWRFDDDWFSALSVTLDRRGEGRVEHKWEAKGFRKEPFPSGVVETMQTYRLRTDWTPTRILSFGLDLSLSTADNYENHEGATNTEFYAGLQASYLLDWRVSF